jgi:hypothetical protein
MPHSYSRCELHLQTFNKSVELLTRASRLRSTIALRTSPRPLKIIRGAKIEPLKKVFKKLGKMTPMIHLIHLKIKYHKMTPKALKVHLKPIKLLSKPIICTLRATLVISRRAISRRAIHTPGQCKESD